MNDDTLESENKDMQKIIFKTDKHPYQFSWVVGGKTINILEGNGKVCCMSFGHELSQTTKRGAKKTICGWLADNNVKVRQNELSES